MEYPDGQSLNHPAPEPPQARQTRRAAVRFGQPAATEPHRVDRAAAVDAVLARLPQRSGTRWIGVDGKGAAGKTTLAQQIAAALPGAVIVQIDDFARPDLRGWDRERFIAQVLEPLISGRPATYQRWDFERNDGADWRQVPTGVPVVVEGVSSTDVRLGVPWDVTVWVDVPREVRLRRATERDGPEMLERWLTDWMPSEDEYEAAQQPQRRVDLVVLG